MQHPKVYHQDSNVYGEMFITVNGEFLPVIRYHQPYGGLCDEDIALTILADYLEENLSKEQLNKGIGKRWKLHKDFAKEVISPFWKIIWSEDIQLWIDQHAVWEEFKLSITKTINELDFIMRYSRSEFSSRKVYQILRDVDGSNYLTANGEIIE